MHYYSCAWGQPQFLRKNAPRSFICGFPSLPGIAPGVAPRIVVFVLLKSWDFVFREWNFRNENSAQRGSFWPDIPADIRPKTSVRPSKSWKNKRFGTDIPRGRPRKNFGLKNFGLIFRSLEFRIPRMEFRIFRELLREYPGTLRELREWPFPSESVFPEIGWSPAECTAVAAMRLRMRMRILTRPENSLANFGHQLSIIKLRIGRCEGIRASECEWFCE